MNKLHLEALHSWLSEKYSGSIPEILTEGSLGYESKRQVFNTKFNFRPLAIVMATTAEQVSEIVKFANERPGEIVLRVRSGGHDHEGECAGTDTLLLDLSNMNAMSVDEQSVEPIVRIGAGARFERIKPFLDERHLGIAHGTCETVGIAGFTLGGGWGPWTRLHGMGCERLVGATVVLGNGEIVELGPEAPAGSAEAELLWALRGGGGLSYGIVTELRFKAFALPRDLCTFNLECIEEWPDRKALEILKCWEDAVTGNQNPQLIGTNLKMVALPLSPGEAPNPDAVLVCTFNGYFAGTEQEARAMIAKYFGLPQDSDAVSVQVHRSSTNGLKAPSSPTPWHFSSWDRHVRSKPPQSEQLTANGNACDPRNEICLETEDGPAPHKITSRLANASEWNDESRKALICALQSPLVPRQEDVMVDGEHNAFPIVQYITLGAITGPFYARYDESRLPRSAFPYKDRLFTIQFQAWWDQYLQPNWEPNASDEKRLKSALANRPWVNRAEDWIAACRDHAIPGTSGAFISFKDSSVPTKTYFAQSYDALREVKLKHSKDDHVLFRSGKTIL
jgi:hypothetical protein